MWTFNSLQATFGFSQMQNFKAFVEGWNIIGDRYRIEDRYVIIDTQLYNDIQAKYKNKLGKPFFSYKGKYSFYREDKWQQKLKEDAEAERKRQKLEKEREEEAKLMQKMEDECDALNYPTWDSIERKVGDYWNHIPGVRYFWSLIGNNYRKANWQGDILIEQNCYDIIQKETKKIYGLTGKQFLNRKFRVNGYSHGITGTYKDGNNSNYGVYGIYQNGELVYIGKTSRSFEERWKEHLAIFKGEQPKPAGMILYNNIDLERDQVEFKVLLDVYSLLFEGTIGPRDLNVMEFSLISLYKPKYNIVGVRKAYELN